MTLATRLIGLLFAAGVGYGLYTYWPDVWRMIRNPWTRDLNYLIMLIYGIAGLWIAEKIWSFIVRFLPGSSDV
ncbi:MAG: hypothetical protein AAGC83_03105 [Pseudomonadota bacterium]